MAQTDEAAAAAAQGQFSRFVTDAAEQRGQVDESAGAAVERDRGIAPADIYARWQTAARSSREALTACAPSDRVHWVAARWRRDTLTTTRLSECWIHTGDVVEAIGGQREPSERLWHLARLAWRTIPYAFEREGEPAPGPVAVRLEAPDGSTWSFGDDDSPRASPGRRWTSSSSPPRRREPAQTALKAEGPDADAVLRLVRTYASPNSPPQGHGFVDSLEVVRPTRLESQAAAGDEVAHGARDEHSSAAAWSVIRLAKVTAMPETSSPRSSTSPTCTPARADRPIAGQPQDLERRHDRAHRAVEHGKDAVTGRLDDAAAVRVTARPATSSCESIVVCHRWSPSDRSRSVDPTMSVKSTAASRRLDGRTGARPPMSTRNVDVSSRSASIPSPKGH